MVAVDPTYPLLPVATFLSAVMLLLVLLTSFIRQKWNLGITFLCFWLFIEGLVNGANFVIWSDNSDIKLWVYCDIVSRLQEFTAVVKPMATLIITRRLYIIASLQSVELPSKSAGHWNRCVEWTMGFIIPVLVAGPIYYVIEDSRFQVEEGFGCTNAGYASILSLLIFQSWSVVPPFLSITIYYPRVARIFYRQSRDVNRFLRSNGSVSRTSYFHILALASVDVLLTFPIGVVNIALSVSSVLAQDGLPLYPGWKFLHDDWQPSSFSYAEIQALGGPTLALQYFTYWTSPILAFTIFGLFGVTAEARASYWHIVCTIGGWFGWKAAPSDGHSNVQLGIAAIEVQPQETISLDAEMGTRPSFIDFNLVPFNRGGTGQSNASPNMGENIAGKAEPVTAHELELNPDPLYEPHMVSSGGNTPRSSASHAVQPILVTTPRAIADE